MSSAREMIALLVTLIAAALLPLPGAGGALADSPQPVLSVAPKPATKTQPEYGAIAFAPDGSFFSVWKIGSREEAEEKARIECNALERGLCEAISFRGEVCASIASGQINKRRKITYSGGGLTPDDAERIALARCNADRRARGTCELRTTVCGDGRTDTSAETAKVP